jgi:serine/threonine protein kinase
VYDARLLQYKDGGKELGEYMNKIRQNPDITLNKYKKLLLGLEPLFYGLKEMYKKRFIHFDIKQENIVINPKTLQCKYIDFGLATHLKDIGSKTYRFTFGYFAYPFELLYLTDKVYSKRKSKPTQFNNMVKKHGTKIYDDSYTKDIDGYIYGGSLYTHVLESPHTFMYQVILEKRTKQELLKDICKKIDVFSLGLVILLLYTDLTGILYNINASKNGYSPIRSALYDLIKKMTAPIFMNRINGEEAYDIYCQTVKRLCKNKSVQADKEKMKPKKSIPKPPSLQDMMSNNKKHNQKKKECKTHQILNPKTNRCVKRTGAIGRKILRPQNNPKPNNPKPNAQKKGKQLKPCKTTQIRNPKTNRCVNRKGVIGRKILNQ